MWLQWKELIIQRGDSPKLKGFMSDLESAPVRTLWPIFPPDRVSTCFFHLAQAHWRKIQSPGLMEQYICSDELSLLLRSFTALAFVPEGKVTEYFNIVSESVPADSSHAVFEFAEYIADTYVGKEVMKEQKRIGEDSENLVIRLRRMSRWKTQVCLKFVVSI